MPYVLPSPLLSARAQLTTALSTLAPAAPPPLAEGVRDGAPPPLAEGARDGAPPPLAEGARDGS
jgi:hypothetical protein